MKRWLRGFGRGMTLVELMAALAVGAILVLAAGKIMVFCQGIFIKTAGQNKYDMVLLKAADFLDEKLAYADYVEVSLDKTPVGPDDHVIEFTKDGRVMFDGEDAFQDPFYGGMKITLELDGPHNDEDTYTLAFDLFIKDKENKAFYSKRSVIQLVNLELGGQTVAYPAEWDRTWDSDTENIYLHYRQGLAQQSRKKTR